MITVIINSNKSSLELDNILWALQTASLSYELAECDKRNIEEKKLPLVCINNIIIGGYYELTKLLDSGEIKSKSWICKVHENNLEIIQAKGN